MNWDRIVSAKDLMHLKKTYIAVLSLATNNTTTSFSFTHDYSRVHDYNITAIMDAHVLDHLPNQEGFPFYHRHFARAIIFEEDRK